MQHIALVTTSYPDAASGAEAAGSFVADFAAELAKHVRTTVLTAALDDSETTDGSLTVKRFAVPRLPLAQLNPARPADWAAIVSTLRAGQRAVISTVRADAPDHILGLWVLPSGYWAGRALRGRAATYSVWALGSDIWTLGKVPVVRTLLRRVLQGASSRYADGLALAADVQRIGGRACAFMPSTRCVPYTRSAPVSGSPPYKLAFLGRWHANKGIDLLLDALGDLRDGDWDRIARLRIYGGGPLRERVLEAAATLAAAGRPVETGGYLDKTAAAELIGWADYLLLPSRIESIPVIFSDALQLGTPIVATPVGDLPRLFEENAVGVLAARTAPESFADALRAALDADARKFAGAIGGARSEFDLPAIVQRFLRDVEAETR